MLFASLLHLVILASLLHLVLSIDPQYAKNYTVYHVNPHQYGAIPGEFLFPCRSGSVRTKLAFWCAFLHQ